MIQVATEELLGLREAAVYVSGRFPRGEKRLHVSTVFRWATKGIRGVRLETICVGAARSTSTQAIQRFFDRLAGSETSAPPAGTSEAVAGSTPSADRDRRAAIAEAALERAGV